MTFKIPQNIGESAIQLWLQGKSRKEIAVTCGIGDGTVSNIVDDWKRSLIYPADAEALRELAINFDGLGINATQCAEGFRIYTTMVKLGIDKNEFESFISEVYNHCQKIDFTPDKIAFTLKGFVEFSKEKDVPFAKIPDYIEEKKNEIRKIEHDIEILQKQKKELKIETSTLEELRDTALEHEKMTSSELGQYSSLKTELIRQGLLIDKDISKFVELVYSIKELGFDVNKVLSPYQNSVLLEMTHETFSYQIKEMSTEKRMLEQSCSLLRNMESFHAQRLYVYDELEYMGLGLDQLRLLRNTIREIAHEKGVSDSAGVMEFFRIIEHLYDVKLKQKAPHPTSTILPHITNSIGMNSNSINNYYYRNIGIYNNNYSIYRRRGEEEKTTTK